MRVGIRAFPAAGKVCKVLLLGVVTIAMVVPRSDVAFSQSGTGAGPYTFTLIDTPSPNMIGAVALGINNGGQIVGYFSPINSQHGFLLSGVGGTFTQIDVPNSFMGPGSTFAYGINDAGQIVGTFQYTSFFRHGFLRDAGGGFTQIDLGTGFDTEVHGINGTGQIVGFFQDTSNFFHGFVGGTPIDFPNAFAT